MISTCLKEKFTYQLLKDIGGRMRNMEDFMIHGLATLYSQMVN